MKRDGLYSSSLRSSLYLTCSLDAPPVFYCVGEEETEHLLHYVSVRYVKVVLEVAPDTLKVGRGASGIEERSDEQKGESEASAGRVVVWWLVGMLMSLRSSLMSLQHQVLSFK